MEDGKRVGKGEHISAVVAVVDTVRGAAVDAINA